MLSRLLGVVENGVLHFRDQTVVHEVLLVGVVALRNESTVALVFPVRKNARSRLEPLFLSGSDRTEADALHRVPLEVHQVVDGPDAHAFSNIACVASSRIGPRLILRTDQEVAIVDENMSLHLLAVHQLCLEAKRVFQFVGEHHLGHLECVCVVGRHLEGCRRRPGGRQTNLHSERPAQPPEPHIVVVREQLNGESAGHDHGARRRLVLLRLPARERWDGCRRHRRRCRRHRHRLFERRAFSSVRPVHFLSMHLRLPAGCLEC